MKYLLFLLLFSCDVYQTSSKTEVVKVYNIKDLNNGFCLYSVITLRQDWDMTTEITNFCGSYKDGDTITISKNRYWKPE